MRKCRYLPGLVVVLACGEQLPTTVFSAREGIPTSFARIVADSRGFVWLPSSEGLTRFDGNGFRTFTSADGLPTGITSDIIERPDGTYWIAAWEHLCLFDPRSTGARFRCESPKLGAIRALLEDQHGLWCGTETGLWRRAAGGQSWKPVPGLVPARAGSSIEVNRLLKDSRGDVWASSYSGLYRFRLNGAVERWGPDQGIEMDNGTALSETPNAIWAGTQIELFRFSIDRKTGAAEMACRYNRSHGLPSGHASDVRFWRGQVWAATFQGLARQLSSGRWQAVELDPSVSGFPIDGLAVDALGYLWGNTNGGGLVRLSGSGLSSFSDREGLALRNVWAVFEDRQGDLMAVTKDEEHYFLNRFDGYRFSPVRLNSLSRISFNWTWSQIVVHSRTGDWWLATGSGLRWYRHGLEAPPSPPTTVPGLRDGNVSRVFEDSRGALWASSHGPDSNGLYRRDPETGRFEKFSELDGLPPMDHVENLPCVFVEDRGGTIWIGMLNGGLVRFRQGKFQQFAPASGAPQRGVRALLLDGQGRLWIGSSGEGVFRIDKPDAANPRFSVVYTKSNGLSSNGSQALAEDTDGRIYSTEGSSVDRIDPRSPLEARQVHHFATGDGLLVGGLRVAFRDRHGALWFGGNQGLLRIEPQKDRVDPPAVFVYSILVNGERRPISDVGDAEPAPMSLSSSERQVQVDFGGFRHDLVYQARLSGVDRDWTPPSSSRVVRFASLAPGNYELAIRALSPEGVVSARPALVRFAIAAPFWQRWWFLLLGTSAITGLAYAIHLYRLRQALALERVRTRLATDLHDDLGAGLAEIALVTEMARRKPAGTTSEAMEYVAARARTLRGALGDIVWSVDPERDHLTDFVRRLRDTALSTLEAAGCNAEVVAPGEKEMDGIELRPELRRHLFLFCKEAVSNIARHAGATTVRLEIALNNGDLHASICDDGRGFDPGAPVTGRGLAGLRYRAIEMGGSLRLESAPGKGTFIELCVGLKGRRVNGTGSGGS